jgi:hypothetical protein
VPDIKRDNVQDIWIFLDESGTHDAADRLLVGAIVAPDREALESAVIDAFEDVTAQSANWTTSDDIKKFISRGFHFKEDSFAVRKEFINRLSTMNVRIHVAYSTSGPGSGWRPRAASMYYTLARSLLRRYRDYSLHFVFEHETGMNRLYSGIIKLAAESLVSSVDDVQDVPSWDVTVADKDDPALGVVDYVLAAVSARLSVADSTDFKARYIHAFAGHVAQVMDYDKALRFSSRASRIRLAGAGAHDGRARVAPGSQMSQHQPMTPQSPPVIEGTSGVEQPLPQNIIRDIPSLEPPRITRRQLPSFIGCSEEALSTLLVSVASDRAYSITPMFINGRLRFIEIPDASLSAVQRVIFTRLVDLELDLPACVHGYVKGRSHISNAAAHVGKAYLQKFDIKDFFPSIASQAVVDVLNEVGFTADATEVLSRLLTYQDRLPLGACTSPLLSNLCLLSLDTTLQDLAIERGLVYTRYSDDMTFSGDEEFDIKEEVDIAVSSSGFQLNPRKSVTARYGQAQYVTGLSISDNAGPRLPKRFKRRLRQILYYNEKFGSNSFESGRIDIAGVLQYARGVEPTFVEKLAQAFPSASSYAGHHGNSIRDIEQFDTFLMQDLNNARSTPQPYRGTRTYSGGS